MEGKKIGREIGKIWLEDRNLFRLCYVEAQRRIPIRYNSRSVPLNIKRVREETLKVYRMYKSGRLTLFEGIYPGDAGRLVKG